MQEILTTFSSFSGSFAVNLFMGLATTLLFYNTIYAMLDEQELKCNGLLGYLTSLILAICGLVSIITLWIAYNSKLTIADMPISVFVSAIALSCFLVCFVFCLISINHHDKKE